MSQIPQPAALAHGDALLTREAVTEDRTISVLDLLLVVARGKRIMLLGLLIGAVLGLVAAFLTPKMYKSRTEILPPSQAQTTLSAIVGSLSGGTGSSKDPSDLWVGLFRSETLQSRVVEQNKLMQNYHVSSVGMAIQRLNANTEIEGTKQGLIDLDVKDHDPKLAATIANSYVEALKWLNDNMAITEAGQRRLFWQKEMDRQKDALEDEEAKFATIQHRTGMISMGAQENAALAQVTSLRAEITNREVQLGAMRTAATAENPEVKSLEAEIATLQEELKKFQEKDAFAPGSVEISTSQVPELTIEYVRQLREVKYHEALFDLTTRQFEAAQIDESRATPVIQVVDKAEPAAYPSSPSRGVYMLLGAFLGFVVGAGFVAVREVVHMLRQRVDDDEKLKLLRREMWFRRS